MTITVTVTGIEWLLTSSLSKIGESVMKRCRFFFVSAGGLTVTPQKLISMRQSILFFLSKEISGKKLGLSNLHPMIFCQAFFLTVPSHIWWPLWHQAGLLSNQEMRDAAQMKALIKLLFHLTVCAVGSHCRDPRDSRAMTWHYIRICVSTVAFHSSNIGRGWCAVQIKALKLCRLTKVFPVHFPADFMTLSPFGVRLHITSYHVSFDWLHSFFRFHWHVLSSLGMRRQPCLVCMCTSAMCFFHPSIHPSILSYSPWRRWAGAYSSWLLDER